MGDNSRLISFELGGMLFEYDAEKNQKNIEKHGIDFKTAARVFFDYDRIEYSDEDNATNEDRYDVIGDLSAGRAHLIGTKDYMIGNIGKDDVVYVVYTERYNRNENGNMVDVTRLISARYATGFERGLYYGKY